MRAASSIAPRIAERPQLDVCPRLEHREFSFRQGGLAADEFTLHHEHRALAMVGRHLERGAVRELRVNMSVGHSVTTGERSPKASPAMTVSSMPSAA